MHVAATYDGTTIKLYINGVQEGASLAGPAAIGTNTLPLGLGAQPTAPAAAFYNGLLDDARIYPTALSATEIADLVIRRPATPPQWPWLTATRRPRTRPSCRQPRVSCNDTDADSNPLTAVL